MRRWTLYIPVLQTGRLILRRLSVNSVASLLYQTFLFIPLALSNSEITNVPTSGIVALQCAINDWDELGDDCAEVEYFETPKLLQKRQTY